MPECPSGRIAFVVDGVVVGAPTITRHDFGPDEVSVGGHFTETGARATALAIEAGPLPEPLVQATVDGPPPGMGPGPTPLRHE